MAALPTFVVPPDPETWIQAPVSCQQIHNRECDFPPPQGYSSFPACLIDKTNLSLQHAASPLLDNLMAALPQWNLEPPISSHSSLPWRVIWPYHPIIETFGLTSKGLDDEDLFKYPGALPTDIREALPTVMLPLYDFIVVEPKHRIIVYHGLTAVRHRCANFIMPRLRAPLTPYFHDLTTRTDSSELPVPSAELIRHVEDKLRLAYEMLQGRHPPAYKADWEAHAKKWYIDLPPSPIPTPAAPPPTLTDRTAFPTLQSVAAPKALNTSKAASPSLRSSTEAGALRPRVSASAIATQPRPEKLPLLPHLSLPLLLSSLIHLCLRPNQTSPLLVLLLRLLTLLAVLLPTQPLLLWSPLLYLLLPLHLTSR